MLVDGIVSDVSKHVGLFAERTDVTVDDSIAAHPSGLFAVIGVLAKSRTVTNEEPISIPYRHGILHGRELAYDNKTSAAKCWSLVFAIRDWAKSFEEAKQREPINSELPLTEQLKHYAKSRELYARIREWRARDPMRLDVGDDSESGLQLSSPELETWRFLENWKQGRFGPLSQQLLDYAGGHPGKKAGAAKRDFGPISIESFRILNAPSRFQGQAVFHPPSRNPPPPRRLKPADQRESTADRHAEKLRPTPPGAVAPQMGPAKSLS